jgi:hypothetical protein
MRASTSRAPWLAPALAALAAAACQTSGGTSTPDSADTSVDHLPPDDDAGTADALEDAPPPDDVVEVSDTDAGPTLTWPNEHSSASSDPWLVEHHAELREMRPRVLVLNFVNAKTMEEAADQLADVVEAVAESSRYRGFDDPLNPPPFFRYELAYLVDLRDLPPPPGWTLRNSTRYPREDPPTGTWGFDYERLFGPEFAAYYGVADPDDPSRFLDLCELVDHGLVHDVWIIADADVPDAGAAEILELKPYYDEHNVRRDRPLNRCAGNGCFDDDDAIPEHCTRTVRIAFFNHTRGVGCFLESLSHGFESIGAWNPGQLPYLSRYFRHWAAYDLDSRFGLAWDSWYICPIGVDCLSYPSPTSASYDIEGVTGTLDPYDPVCGNVHWPPNARHHYDLDSPFTVQSTCLGYRRGGGPGDADVPLPFTSNEFRRYRRLAPDCMGEWLVWWRQNVPGPDNGLLDDDGNPLLNWWPFVYY